MPDYPQGTFEYTGGIDGQSVGILGGWEVTLTHGLTPACITVSMPMKRQGDDPPNKNGDVILRYGQTKITLKNCTIDKISQDVGGGLVWHAVIFDRRYKWRWGQISGFYNVRWRNGTDAREETKKNPVDLAELCLDAMGETDYDTDKLLPFVGTDWPEITWNVANPAEALQSLCERYELRAVFDWKKDRVVIVKVGEGEKLKNDLKFTQYSGAFDPPEKPGKLVLMCGPSSVQYDFATESVAIDVDGKIKTPDRVSYFPGPPVPPSGGTAPDFTSGTIFDDRWLPWCGIDDGFYNITTPYLRQLAIRSMLRLYRIVPPKTMDGLAVIAGDNPKYSYTTIGQGAFGPIQVQYNNPGDFGNIVEDTERSWLWQIALQPEQNDRLSTLADPLAVEFDEYNKEVSQSRLPAWVYGQYFDADLGSNVLQDDLDNDGDIDKAKRQPMSGLKKLNPGKVFSPAQQSASATWSQDVPAELQEKVKESGFYTGGFSIDAERGLLEFSEPVFQMLAPKNSAIVFQYSNGDSMPQVFDNAKFPAVLFLRTRFFVRDKDTREFIRYQKTRILDEKSDTVRVVVRDDLIFKLTYRPGVPIGDAGYPPEWSYLNPEANTENNKDAIDKAADAYLDQIEEEYETRRPETIVHPMFVDYTLDGAIRQITWMVNAEGHASTRASRDCEELHIVRDYGDRRLVERLKAIADEKSRLDSLPRPESGGNSFRDVSGIA